MGTLLYGLFLACLYYTGMQGVRAANTGDRRFAELAFIGAGLTACAAALMGVV